MKCLILAGGKGERLWPLSRSNLPKQFIKIQKNHSLFQETVARNLAYCDEFIIVTNYAYRPIIANQMEAFQGVSYRCVFEEEGRRTTAAITLACLGLQPSEYVFVVSSDHLIDTGDCPGLSYKDAILKAKEEARKGLIVLFGTKAEKMDSRFGYFTEGGAVFVEKPDRIRIRELEKQTVYQNLGMLLFQNGTLLNEMRIFHPGIMKQCRAARGKAVPEGLLYSAETLQTIESISIEHSLIEWTANKKGIAIGFGWSDIGSLEDLDKTELSNDGVGIIADGVDSTIINRSPRQAVVVNDLDNVLVVNTTDAVYVGRKGKSHHLKEILQDHEELEPYKKHGTVFYRPWGYYEKLTEEAGFRVSKVVLLPGKTIYRHRHARRAENWTVVSGSVRITLDGKAGTYEPNGSASALPGTSHQISNPGEQPVVLIETAVGDIMLGADMVSGAVPDLTEADLGLRTEPLIRLAPAYKDYLWGGIKLREIYHKQCDYDVIAESWELSAHPAGNSMIASGRHKGLSFGKYLETAGREVLGWKCRPLQSFPLLVKFIDAKENLSVQVHPNDDYALENENEYGKNEMWYVVDAEPGAGLYVGFSKDTGRAEVQQRVEDNSILDILNFFPTKPGDVFFIPAGTVHAIGAGNLICEIQQSSNCTYRLYDYDRRDKYGIPRELHLDKALDVLNYRKYEPETLEQENGLIRCKYFEAAFLDVDGETGILLSEDSFCAVNCIRGSGTIRVGDAEQELRSGDSFFIPAQNERMRVSGELSLVLTKI